MDGQFLAVGSYDNYIDVYDVGKQYGRVGVAKGHSSYIRHLDWSSDSTVLQSNSGNHELKFWEMPSGKEIKHANDTRNVDWHSWTCVVGWPVQGIWPRLSSGTGSACSMRFGSAGPRRVGKVGRKDCTRDLMCHVMNDAPWMYVLRL